jgi:hypothetical protein
MTSNLFPQTAPTAETLATKINFPLIPRLYSLICFGSQKVQPNIKYFTLIQRKMVPKNKKATLLDSCCI